MDLSETDLGRKSILLAVFGWIPILPATIVAYAIFFTFPVPILFNLASFGALISFPSLLLWRKTVLKPYLQRNVLKSKKL